MLVDQIPHLVKYYPRSGDVLLFRPSNLKEWLISKVLRCPFHHTGMIQVTEGDAFVLEQNVDFYPREEHQLEKYLNRYEFAVIRCRYITNYLRYRLVSRFRQIRRKAYNYRDALRTWLGNYRAVPGEIYYWHNFGGILLMITRATPGRQRPHVEFRNSFTCTAAIGLAHYFTLVNQVNVSNLFPGKCLWYLRPDDFLDNYAFTVLGRINANTFIPNRDDEPVDSEEGEIDVE